MRNHLSPNARILIADDQVDVLEALRLLLKGEGYHIETATSPKGVLKALEGQAFDILLMDLNYARDTTSGQEGLDLLSRIQTLNPTLPVVVMTAWGTVELAVEAMHRGVRDFVQKPWENDRLLTILRTQIELSQSLRKTRSLEAEKKLLTREIQEAKDLQGLLKVVAEGLLKALQNRAVVIFTKAPHDLSFWATAKVGVPDEILGRLRFDSQSRLLMTMNTPIHVGHCDLPEEETAKLREANSVLITPVRFKDELIAFISLGSNLSSEEYDTEDIQFVTQVAEHLAAGVNNLRLREQEAEFEEAKMIQQGLLPQVIPQIAGYKISSAWQPARTVSGDYFDVLKFNEEKLALCIGDVAGKGMAAALLMSNLQAAVKAFANETLGPPALCEKVNRVICNNTAPGKFISFFYCLLDARRKTLAYSNAGHNPPVLIRGNGSQVRLREGGAVLGVFQNSKYQLGSVDLASGDRLLLFTDGVTEITDSKGEEFDETRLIQLLMMNRDLDVGALQNKMMAALTDFSGGDFHDDATLLVMSIE